MLTGTLKENKPVELTKGQKFQIVIDSAMEGDNTRVSTNYRELTETVQIGSKILIDNGALECEVTEVAEVSNSLCCLFLCLCHLTRLPSVVERCHGRD